MDPELRTLLKALLDGQINLADGQVKLTDGLTTLTKRVEQLAEGQARHDARLDKVDARLDKVDAHLDKVDAHLDKVDAHLDKVDARLDKVDARLDRLAGAQLRTEEELADLAKFMREGFAGLGRRIDQLAEQVMRGFTSSVERDTKLEARVEKLEHAQP